MKDEAAPGHILIMGPMGAGKTTVGGHLATALGRPFHDSDLELTARTGESGAEIAERLGVARLHEMELEVFLAACESDSPSVIAPAASVVDNERGRKAMSEHLTIRLTAPDDVLAARIEDGGHRRPISEPEREMLRNLRERASEQAAVLTIDTAEIDPDEAVRRIVEWLAASDPAHRSR